MTEWSTEPRVHKAEQSVISATAGARATRYSVVATNHVGGTIVVVTSPRLAAAYLPWTVTNGYVQDKLGLNQVDAHYIASLLEEAYGIRYMDAAANEKEIS